MKLNDFTIEELRDICNHAGWSCRDQESKYKTKESIVTFLRDQGVTDPPIDGKKLWSATFNVWVNEVLGLEEYAQRVMLSDREGYKLDVPNLPEYIEPVVEST